MNDFGLAHIKGEGMTIHPDDANVGMNDPTDKEYMDRLREYHKDYGKSVFCMYSSKPWLLEKLKEEIR